MSPRNSPSENRLSCKEGHELSSEAHWLVERMRQTLMDCRSWMCDSADIPAATVFDKVEFAKALDRIEQRQTELLQRITSLINSPALLAARSRRR
jgi:hypothetical protein